MKTFIKILAFVLYILYSVNAGAQTVEGYRSYRYLNVLDALGIPDDSTQLAPAQKTIPHIAIVEDSLFMVWSVAQQKYIFPRGADGSIVVSWADIVGSISGNAQLVDSLAAKQPLLPYSAIPNMFIGADWQVHSLDSIISALNFVRSTDSVFINVQGGTADSLSFVDPLYRYGPGGNTVGIHYDWDVFNAQKLRGVPVEAVTPKHGYVLGYDSIGHIWRSMKLDSLVGGGIDLSDYYTKAESDGRYLQSYTETDATALAALIDTANQIRADMAALGGGGATPGIDNVLAIDQTLTSTRDIGLDGHQFSMWQPTGYWNEFQVDGTQSYIAQSRAADDYGLIRTFRSFGGNPQNKAYMEATGNAGSGGFQSAGISVNAFVSPSTSDPNITMLVTDFDALSTSLIIDENVTVTGNIFGTRRSQFKIDDMQLQIIDPYTPSGTAETTWGTGTLLWDDNYIYIKTSAGFKRAALSTF